MPRTITAFSNPLIKRVRSLREKKGRRLERLFLAEGLRILTEARETGRVPLWLFFAPEGAAHPLVDALIAAVEQTGGEAIQTDRDILSKLSGKDNPQAILGVFAEPPTDLTRVDRSSADLWIVAQALRDPGNIGTILRTGDAVGAGGLILIDDCADPFSVEAVRASMGAIFTQTLATARWDDFLPWMRAGPGLLVATALDGAVDYQTPAYTRPCFLLVGNESQGLPPAYAAAADIRVKVPMLGKADSLNAAVATAVAAYEIRNQWRRG
jgi:TrmH family RNA methyltransferase